MRFEVGQRDIGAAEGAPAIDAVQHGLDFVLGDVVGLLLIAGRTPDMERLHRPRIVGGA